MQSLRNELVFELEHCVDERRDARLGVVGPGRLRRGKIQLRGLRLDATASRSRSRSLAHRATDRASARRGLEIEETAVEPGLGDRRRQIADQRRRRAPLGNGALGRIVGGVEIEVRQVADQPVRPARADSTDLLARHEFERAMRAEVQDGMGAEVLAQPAVERRERVRRRKALLEQEPHRIALVAEGRLHADEDVAEVLAEHEDRAAVRLDLARRGSPLRFDFGEPALAAHVIVDAECEPRHWRGTEARCVAAEDLVRAARRRCGHLDRVAGALAAR